MGSYKRDPQKGVKQEGSTQRGIIQAGSPGTWGLEQGVCSGGGGGGGLGRSGEESHGMRGLEQIVGSGGGGGRGMGSPGTHGLEKVVCNVAVHEGVEAQRLSQALSLSQNLQRAVPSITQGSPNLTVLMMPTHAQPHALFNQHNMLVCIVQPA